MHISHLLDSVSKHQLQTQLLRNFGRPLLCESGENGQVNAHLLWLNFLIYLNSASAFFPNPDSCTFNSRRIHRKSICAWGSMDNYFLVPTLMFIFQLLFKASCMPESVIIFNLSSFYCHSSIIILACVHDKHHGDRRLEIFLDVQKAGILFLV